MLDYNDRDNVIGSFPWYMNYQHILSFFGLQYGSIEVGKQIDARDAQVSSGYLENTIFRPLKHMYVKLPGLLGVPTPRRPLKGTGSRAINSFAVCSHPLADGSHGLYTFPRDRAIAFRTYI